MSSSGSPTTPAHPGYVSDIRKLTFPERQSLNTGPTIKLYDDTEFVVEIPRKLFLAATSEARLIPRDSDKIRLPPTGFNAIMTVCCYLLALVDSPEPFNLRHTFNMESDLMICRAGRNLGMEQYISHMHKHYWWRLYNRPFSAADVDIIVRVALDSEDPFLRLISEILAELLRESDMDDLELWKAYIASNPMLESMVIRTEKRYQTQLRINNEKASRVRRREEREIHEAELQSQRGQKKAQVAAGHEDVSSAYQDWINGCQNYETERRDTTMRPQAMWEQRQNREAELSKSLQANMLQGKSAAAVYYEEAGHYQHMRGAPYP